jgi:hypothetical protein
MRVANVHLDRTREDVIDGLPIHASRNLAKKILEWEYGIEIERTRMLMRPEEQRPTSSSNTISSHEGTCPQGAGVSYGQAVLQHDVLQAVYTLLVPLPRKRLPAKSAFSVSSRVQPRPSGERSVS